MPLNSFALTGKASIIGSNVSQSVALSVTGTPTTVIVTNLGTSVGYVVLGTSAPTATPTNAIPVLPNSSVVLTMGANTFAAAIGAGSELDFALGT